MMKRLLALALSAMMVLGLTACGGGSDENKRESAQSVVETAIKSVQNADLTKIQEYWGEAMEEATDVTDTENAAQVEAVLKAMVSKLTYEITSAKEDEAAGTATVSVAFTNVDMSTVLSSFFQEILADALANAMLPEEQQMSEEEAIQKYMDKLVELIGAADAKTVTNTVELALTLDKTTDKWVLTQSDAAVDAMLGGIVSAAESMGDAFGGSSGDSSEQSPTNAMDTEGKLGEYYVKITGYTLSKDYEDKDAIIINYDFTNNSADTTSAMMALNFQLFQDGVELDTAIVSGDDSYDSDAEMKDIKSGVTLSCQAAYVLGNTTSPVEVEVAELFSFTNEQVATTFDLTK